MALEVQINEALKLAMKAQDEARKRTIRAIKSQILLLKTDGSGAEVTDEKITQTIQKMVKQGEESLATYEQQKRDDLAIIEREEVAILKEFLPKQLSTAELEGVLRSLITELGVSSPKDMGKVIGAASKQLAGKADGKTISETVKRLLS